MSPVLFQSFPQKHQNRSINFQYKINPCRIPETAATGGVLWKKDIIKNFRNFTGKRLKACNFIKKGFQHRCFPVKFVKFLRTPISRNICGSPSI